jgi:hypothetical protein
MDLADRSGIAWPRISRVTRGDDRPRISRVTQVDGAAGFRRSPGTTGRGSRGSHGGRRAADSRVPGRRGRGISPVTRDDGPRIPRVTRRPTAADFAGHTGDDGPRIRGSGRRGRGFRGSHGGRPAADFAGHTGRRAADSAGHTEDDRPRISRIARGLRGRGFRGSLLPRRDGRRIGRGDGPASALRILSVLRAAI